MTSGKRPFSHPRGRATLLFLSSLAIVAMYFLLASPVTPKGAAGETPDNSMEAYSNGKLQVKIASLLGSHTLLTGSVTDREEYENPQESLAALLAERDRLQIAQDSAACEGNNDESQTGREDPLPGNITGRFHGTCRSQYPPTVPSLQVRQIWKSPNRRKTTDVSLVTHLSLDQLPKLQYQCEKWSSPIAAAVYVKLPYATDFEGAEGTEDAKGTENSDDAKVHDVLVAAEKELGEFFDRIHELQLPCTLDLLLAYEEHASDDPWVLLYPINALRNRALQLADTDNVLVVDVDTVPNVDLSHDLHIMSLYETLDRVLGNRQVIVLPTLTVMDSGNEDPELSQIQTDRWVNRSLEGADRIRVMNDKGKIKAFDTVRSPMANQDTLIPNWFNATMPYRLHEIHEWYEPVYLAKKDILPWYDERFRGLKLNRAVHTWHLHKLGFIFVVTPRAYVVHVPHVKGLVWLETRRRGHFKKITRMFNQALTDIEEDAYEPVTLFQCGSRRSPKWTWY
jgi:hypothetical protein